MLLSMSPCSREEWPKCAISVYGCTSMLVHISATSHLQQTLVCSSVWILVTVTGAKWHGISACYHSGSKCPFLRDVHSDDEIGLHQWQAESREAQEGNEGSVSANASDRRQNSSNHPSVHNGRSVVGCGAWGVTEGCDRLNLTVCSGSRPH